TALSASVDTGSVKRTAHDMVTHTWQVFYTAAADKYHTVLLEVVPDSRNVCIHFDIIRKSHTSIFTESRVRFLRRHRTHTSADTTFLWSSFVGNTFLKTVESSVQSW